MDDSLGGKTNFIVIRTHKVKLTISLERTQCQVGTAALTFKLHSQAEEKISFTAECLVRVLLLRGVRVV